jgi:hypothetical protein
MPLCRNGKCPNSNCANHADPPGGDLALHVCSVCGSKFCPLCLPSGDGTSCKACNEVNSDPNVNGFSADMLIVPTE